MKFVNGVKKNSVNALLPVLIGHIGSGVCVDVAMCVRITEITNTMQ